MLSEQSEEFLANLKTEPRFQLLIEEMKAGRTQLQEWVPGKSFPEEFADRSGVRRGEANIISILEN